MRFRAVPTRPQINGSIRLEGQYWSPGVVSSYTALIEFPTPVGGLPIKIFAVLFERLLNYY
jgi:hypothetical protein